MKTATQGVINRLDEPFEDNEYGETSMARAYHQWVITYWGGCDQRAALWVALRTFERGI